MRRKEWASDRPLGGPLSLRICSALDSEIFAPFFSLPLCEDVGDNAEMVTSLRFAQKSSALPESLRVIVYRGGSAKRLDSSNG